MEFIVSDMHFYHHNILKFCSETRPWKDVQEMNEALIQHWNSLVGVDDTIYHLGDIFLGKNANVKLTPILKRLNGKNVFIKGNHDYPEVVSVCKLFGEVYDYLKITDENSGKQIVMFHYPISCWDQAHRGSLMMHGHTHGSFQGQGKILDVGYDAHGRILSLDEAIAMADAKEKFTPDGH